MKTVTVKTKSKSYPVYIGSGILDECGNFAADITGQTNAAVITDDIVDKLYSGRVIASLEKAGFHTIKYVIPNGELSKNMETYVRLLAFLSENRLSRNDAVFALGGGVVGDLGGFAAATYLRGIRFVQVPTTLLAAVDSSVGGKTGVNLHAGKNLAGAFYQPELVVCDPDLLSSLPEKIFFEGCAEIIKYAAICDKALFEQLKSPIMLHMEEIIEQCVKIKSKLVAEDEFDRGARQLLNFGHTFGHAVEKCSGYTVSHGSAVSIGMIMAASAAVDMKMCETGCIEELTEIVKAYGLPYRTDFSEEALYNILLTDKKRLGDTITFVLPEKIGRCVLKKFALSDMSKVLHSAMKGRDER